MMMINTLGSTQPQTVETVSRGMIITGGRSNGWCFSMPRCARRIRVSSTARFRADTQAESPGEPKNSKNRFGLVTRWMPGEI
jgi:hypothetical protein